MTHSRPRTMRWPRWLLACVLVCSAFGLLAHAFAPATAQAAPPVSAPVTTIDDVSPLAPVAPAAATEPAADAELLRAFNAGDTAAAQGTPPLLAPGSNSITITGQIQVYTGVDLTWKAPTNGTVRIDDNDGAASTVNDVTATGEYSATMSVDATDPAVYLTVNSDETGEIRYQLDPNELGSTGGTYNVDLDLYMIEVSDTVVDSETGDPIEGATVTLQPEFESDYPNNTEDDVAASGMVTTTTAADGTFTLATATDEVVIPGFEDNRLRLTVSKAGYATFSATAFGSASNTPNFGNIYFSSGNVELNSYFRLQGTLRDAATGDPIANSLDGQVALFDSNGNFEAGWYSFTTDAAGKYTVEMPGYSYLPSGEYLVKFQFVYNDTFPLPNSSTRPDYYPIQYTGGTLDEDVATAVTFNGGEVTNLTTDLVPGSRLEGTLYEAQQDGTANTSVPIDRGYTLNNAFDLYTADGDFLGNLDAYVGNDGTYTTIERLLPGDYKLGFDLNGYYTRYLGSDADSSVDFLNLAPAFTIPGDGSNLTGQDAALYQYVQMEGIITDPDGNGLAEVRVRARFYDAETGQEAFSQNQYLYTSNDGSYNVTLSDQDIVSLREFEIWFGSPSDNTYPYDREFNYLPRWYDNVNARGQASTLEFTLGRPDAQNSEEVNIQYTQEGATLSGEVTDAADPDTKLENVWVYLERHDGGVVDSTFTDVDGLYSFTGLTAGDYILRFDPPGSDYQNEYYNNKASSATADAITVTAGSDTVVDAVGLEKLNQLVITVNDSDGNPVDTTGVTAHLHNPDTLFTPYSQSGIDSTGLITISNIFPDSYLLYLSSSSYEDEWYDGFDNHQLATPINLTNDDAAVTVTLDGVAEAVGNITGEVTRESNGQPLNNVDVYLYEAYSATSESDWIAKDETNSSGVYEFSNRAAGSYKLRFVSSTLVDEYYNDAPTLIEADVVEVSGSDPVVRDAALATGGRIGVTVVTSDTVPLPVAGVLVRAINTTTGAEFTEITDETGSVNISAVPAGTYQITTDAYEQFLAYESDETYTVTVGEITSITLTLERGGRIVGILTSDDGSPIYSSFVRVRLYRDDFELEVPGLTASTDNRGNYEIGGVPFGSYKVFFSAVYHQNEFYDDVDDWFDATVVTVDGTETVDATLARIVPGIITGRVVWGTNDQSADNVEVRAYDAATADLVVSTTTNEDGRYTLSSSDLDGTYIVQFVPPSTRSGFATEWYNDAPNSATAEPISVSPGTPAVDIDATLGQASGAIGGAVTANDTGEALSDVTISAYWADTGDFAGSDVTLADGTGSYSITGLLEGNYVLEATSTGDYSPQWWDFKTSISSADAISVTTTAETADFALRKAGITGQVTTQDGVGVPEVNVYFYGNGTSSWVTTNESGIYTATNLISGTYTIEAIPSPTLRRRYLDTWFGDTIFSNEAESVRVAGEGFVTADIVLQEGISFGGKVVDETTLQPIKGATVSAEPVEGSFSTVTAVADADGNYTLENLVPADYTLQIEEIGSGTRLYPEQWYEGVALEQLATVVEIGPSTEPLSIPLSLDPTSVGATLQGVVVTDDSDTPVEDIEVQLYRDGGSSPIANDVTDENGAFSIPNVAGGDFKLRTRSSAITGLASRYPQQWYNMVQFVDQARVVDLTLGETSTVTVPLALEPQGQFITSAGGTAYLEEDGMLDDSVRIDFPANTFTETVNINVTRVTTPELQAMTPAVPAPTDNTLLLLDISVELASTGEPVTQTNELFTITVSYDDPEDLVGPPQISEGGLTFFYWDSDTETWIDPTAYPPCRLLPDVPGCQQSVDTGNNEATLTIDHFSLFGLASDDTTLYLPLVTQ